MLQTRFLALRLRLNSKNYSIPKIYGVVVVTFIPRHLSPWIVAPLDKCPQSCKKIIFVRYPEYELDNVQVMLFGEVCYNMRHKSKHRLAFYFFLDIWS